MNDYMTDKALAKILDMKAVHVRRMIRNGELPGREIKQGTTLTLRSEFDEWLQQAVTPAPRPPDEPEEPNKLQDDDKPSQTLPDDCNMSPGRSYLQRRNQH